MIKGANIMILVVCTDDPKLLKIAQDSRGSNLAVFGEVKKIFADPLPQLKAGENLFIIAHGAYKGDDNNPVIGDKSKDFYINAVDLFENIKSIFPKNYSGSVYVDACEAADHDEETFSFIEVFLTQIQAVHGNTQVYGRNGAASGRIPLPSDPKWRRATLSAERTA